MKIQAVSTQSTSAIDVDEWYVYQEKQKERVRVELFRNLEE